jgi:hypothetical protein
MAVWVRYGRENPIRDRLAQFHVRFCYRYIDAMQEVLQRIRSFAGLRINQSPDGLGCTERIITPSVAPSLFRLPRCECIDVEAFIRCCDTQ